MFWVHQPTACPAISLSHRAISVWVVVRRAPGVEEGEPFRVTLPR